MRLSAINGLHGFILHSACWDLLNKACEPAGLCLERLISTCESLPFPLWHKAISWGHGYDGLFKLDDEERYPWMERFSGCSISTMYEMGMFSDPNDASVFNRMLPTTRPHFTAITRQLAEGADPFSQLPWEICEMILANVRTSDALNLRLASRAFQPLFSSLSFWLSRFERDGERGFIFEVREAGRNWGVETLLHIHHKSKPSLAMPAVLNRQRIWGLARMLALLTETPLISNNSSQQTFDSGSWIRIAGNEHPSISPGQWKKFWEGCHSGTTICVNVPPDAVKMGITIVNAGFWNYVTGIRLICRDGDESAAGYVTIDKDILFPLSQLHGLRVGMGPGGVRALQVISRGQKVSQWIGNIDGVPQSDRLVATAPITSLSVTFDVSKLSRKPQRGLMFFFYRDIRLLALLSITTPTNRLIQRSCLR